MNSKKNSLNATRLYNQYSDKYKDLLVAFEPKIDQKNCSTSDKDFISYCAKNIYNLENWIKFSDNKATTYSGNSGPGILPHLFDIAYRISNLKFILFDIIDSIINFQQIFELSNSLQLERLKRRPEYMAKLWYDEAFRILKDLQKIGNQLEGEDKKNFPSIDFGKHNEIKNINEIRNHVYTHYIDKKFKNESLTMFSIDIEKIDIVTKNIIDTKHNLIRSNSLLENQNNFLNYLNGIARRR